MTLLFITQKLTGQDSFGVLWVRAFIARGYKVHVLCLEKGNQTFEFPVASMGKERGFSKPRQVWEFERQITRLRYDRVFIHMTPIWMVFGFCWWVLRGIPVYLWYTHYKMQLGVRIFGWFGKRFFCASSQSLPQFEGSPKKVVVGHGIDLTFWPKRRNQANDPHRLLAVHRLSRSKRVEITLRALTLLPSKYTLDIYGIEAERDYVGELKRLVTDLGLGGRVTFHGTVSMDRLLEIYTRHALIVNMASETIDKTMLEAMTCGCLPVTTAANAKAIGLRSPEASYRRQVGSSIAPASDAPKDVAAFIQQHSHAIPLSADAMYEIVKRGHSLEGLMEKMDGYIRTGS